MEQNERKQHIVIPSGTINVAKKDAFSTIPGGLNHDRRNVEEHGWLAGGSTRCP